MHIERAFRAQAEGSFFRHSLCRPVRHEECPGTSRHPGYYEKIILIAYLNSLNVLRI